MSWFSTHRHTQARLTNVTHNDVLHAPEVTFVVSF